VTQPPTRHLTAMMAVPLAGAVVLYSLTVLTGNVWFTLLAGSSLGLLVAAVAWRPRLDGLAVCLSGTSRAAVGDRVVHTMHVHNNSGRQSPALDLRVVMRGLDDLTAYVEPLPPGSRAVVELSRFALSRGVTDTVAISMGAATGLGIMCAHVRGDYRRHLVIHPRRVDVGPLDHQSSRDEQADLVPGPGMDIAGVREWRPGDASGSVHWRSTARRGTLVVRERAVASTRQVVVALACSSDAPDWEDVLAVPPVHSVAALLDWWAGLSESCLPGSASFARAVSSTGSADVHVAASASTPDAWWSEVRQGALRTGTSMQRLRVTT
jgi:uncharacterized protein (DUF58 family)